MPLSQSLSVKPAVCCPCVLVWMSVCVCVCGAVGGLGPSLRLCGADEAGRFVNVNQLGQTYSEGGRKCLNA